MKRAGALAVLLVAALAVVLLALNVGALPVSALEALRAVFGAEHSAAAEAVRQLRLPRVLGAFACGGLLATAGALMQVLLRNPLADPYVLGISGGASVGALLAMLIGAPLVLVNGAAFAGALIVMFAVLGFAHGAGGWTPVRMVLTGVILAAGCGALVALVLTLAPPAALPGMLFWLMGDAGNVTDPLPALGVLALGLLAVWPLARELDVLAAGALAAQSRGVEVARLRLGVYLLASLMTATAVTSVGAVGFVGLIVPHALRRVLGASHRVLLPACVLAGGALLTAADTLARSLASPLQLPVGAVMALAGVPVFLWLLARQERLA